MAAWDLTLDRPTALGAFAVVFFMAGCNSGGLSRSELQIPPVPATPAPAVTVLEKFQGDEPDRPVQTDKQVRLSMAEVPATATDTVADANAISNADAAKGNHEIQLASREEPEVISELDAVSSLEALPVVPAMSLQNAIATSLAQNPDLITLRTQEGVNEAMLGVAKTYPWNPFIQAHLLPQGTPYEAGTTPGSGSGKSNYYIWVMQRFELAHQRRYRKQSAGAALNQTRWNIQQGELLNISTTARLYFTAIYQRDVRNLSRESAQLNADLLGVVERRFKAGLARPAEVTTAKVAVRQSDRQARLAEATYQSANLALRQQLNMPVAEPLELSDRIYDFEWFPVTSLESESATQTSLATRDRLSGLAEELVEGRPDVMAASAGVMVAQANFSLAHAAMYPDFQAGPIYDTGDDGTRFLGVRLQMDIPVFNNGAPLARQRRAEHVQRAVTYQQLLIRATREAEMAIDRYERARRLAAESAVDLSPLSEKMPAELTEIKAQFQAGQADVLAVFATQNSLIQYRKTYLDLLNELAQSAAGVIQATALPLERIVTLNDGSTPPVVSDVLLGSVTHAE